MDKLKLTVISPAGLLLEDNASSVAMKTADGWFGVRAGSFPITAALEKCDIRYVKSGVEQIYHINGGFAEIKNDIITILVE
ncbi:MAG: hypothetical protein PHW77_01820 [Eubacteriales bacterium]|nr:hypothetical protein [Eubacteriales bacterium]